MKKLRKVIPLFLVGLVVIVSCSSDDDIPVVEVPVEPSAAMLVFPENNTECNEGEIVSDLETDVLFKWEESSNTSSYVLQIKNLNTGVSRDISTLSNEFLIRILRGTPYSWSVKSITAASNETAQSETWNFYNAGLPVQYYQPFPAVAMNPKIGATVDEGIVNLQWEASDIDNDIATYKVFFGTDIIPVVEVGNTSINSLDVEVASEQVYYWKVITTDQAGNASDSQIFQFGVN